MTKESFVIHTEYIEDLPEESKSEFLMYIYNYGSKGIEPELDGLAQTIWIKIKRRMDFDSQEWENTRQQRSEAGRKGGLKSAETRSKTKQNEAVLQSVKQDQANEAVYVSVNDTVNVNDTETVNVCPSVPDIQTKGIGTLQKELFKMVQEHNKDAPKERKIPVSNDFWQFTCKESRELLETVHNEPPDRIKTALQNFLQVAKSDTWQKSFTWRMFCKNFQAYTEDYFVLERYLNDVSETEDATKKPENVFFFANKDNPNFHVETFQSHIQDWKEAGRPQGNEYLKLQAEWEMGGINAD